MLQIPQSASHGAYGQALNVKPVKLGNQPTCLAEQQWQFVFILIQTSKDLKYCLWTTSRQQPGDKTTLAQLPDQEWSATKPKQNKQEQNHTY